MSIFLSYTWCGCCNANNAKNGSAILTPEVRVTVLLITVKLIFLEFLEKLFTFIDLC